MLRAFYGRATCSPLLDRVQPLNAALVAMGYLTPFFCICAILTDTASNSTPATISPAIPILSRSVGASMIHAALRFGGTLLPSVDLRRLHPYWDWMVLSCRPKLL